MEVTDASFEVDVLMHGQPVRGSKWLEKRPIHQNTLFFSFRGLDNGVNYRCPSILTACGW